MLIKVDGIEYEIEPTGLSILAYRVRMKGRKTPFDGLRSAKIPGAVTVMAPWRYLKKIGRITRCPVLFVFDEGSGLPIVDGDARAFRSEPHRLADIQRDRMAVV